MYEGTPGSPVVRRATCICYRPGSMRRAAPWLILVFGLAALLVDFWPNLKLPSGGSDNAPRPVETKLGLDLQGGLRVEYQAQCVTVNGSTKCPGSTDLNLIRSIMEGRVNS